MILDTNVLLRLIDGPDGPRYGEVRDRLETALANGERLHIEAATVHEVVFVLRSQATGYCYTRAEIADAIHALVDARELEVEHAVAVGEAATNYGSTNIDFHDCYLAARAHQLGEQVCSFDGDFKRL